MAYGRRLEFDTLRSAAFGAIGANYAAVGSAFSYPVRIISIKNLTDNQVLISFDGVNDHDTLPQGGALVYDISANKSNENMALLAKNSSVYLKHNGVAPTSGSCYITIIYSKGD